MQPDRLRERHAWFAFFRIIYRIPLDKTLVFNLSALFLNCNGAQNKAILNECQCRESSSVVKSLTVNRNKHYSLVATWIREEKTSQISHYHTHSHSWLNYMPCGALQLQTTEHVVFLKDQTHLYKTIFITTLSSVLAIAFGIIIVFFKII